MDRNTATDEPRYDLVVLGAGAAGLLAAARAAERGRRTLLLEKNRKPGIKILMSGGTRCNLTHDCEAAGIVEAFGAQGRFLHAPLAALGPRELVALFEAAGVPTKVEETGKVFPCSNRALDVQQALVHRLRLSGAELVCEEPALDVRRTAGGFEIVTTRRTVTTDALLITTGGQSYPGCGTRGDAYRWLTALGHTIVEPRPALVPIVLDEPWVHELAGVTLPDVGLHVVDPSRTTRMSPREAAQSRGSDRGSFLFTHFGCSGPTPMNVSRAISFATDPQSLQLLCDFLPSIASEPLERMLQERACGKRLVATLLPEEIPQRLAEALVARAGIALETRAAELSKIDRRSLTTAMKRQPLRVTGTRGFPKAEVTAGGVSLPEVDSQNMQSKLVPRLYLAGEVLDLDGPIGGYNFQAAFSTAWLAAESV